MKKNSKILLSLLLTGTIAFQALSFGNPIVQAQETIQTKQTNISTETMELYQAGAYPALSKNVQSDAASTKTASILSIPVENVLYNGLLNAESSIDISSYRLTKTEIKDTMQNLINTCPDLFYVDTMYSVSALEGIVHSIQPVYTASGTTLAQQKAFYNSTMDNILAQIDPTWSDLEKIIFTHDYLCQNYEYDTTLTIHDAYNFFKEKKGVCQSYTLTFNGIMKALGIESSVASSDSMTHIWNVVKLNGKWYHIDVTWDDPLADKFSLASHNNLLLSDTAIGTVRGGSSQYHYNWECTYTCSDTTYDSYFWESSTSPFQYWDNQWYYTIYNANAKEGELYTYNFQTGAKSLITTLGKWTTSGGGFYTNCFSGLDVYNEKVYYNTNTSLCYYKPETQTITTVYTPDISGGIYGMRIEGQTIAYNVSSTPNETGTIYNYTLEAPIETPVPSVNPTATELPTASGTPNSSEIPNSSETPSGPPADSETPNGTPSTGTTASPTVPNSENPSQAPATSDNPSLTPSGSETPSLVPSTDAEATVSPLPSSQPSASPGATQNPSVSDSISGDLDGDKKITLADAQLALKAALKITTLQPNQTKAMDVDNNSKLELKDAQLILKFALKIISKFN